MLALAMVAQALAGLRGAESLQLSVEPSPLPPQAEAAVRIHAPAGGPVRVFASAGEVGPLVETERGIFIATWRPPDDGIPRVAILWAGTPDGDSAWAALPVLASAEATLRGRPRAMVAMSIGATRFGPFRADAAGVVTATVIVPPGATEARSGARHIPLRIPETPTLAVLAMRESVRADSDQKIDVVLLATTPAGAPREGAAFVVKPDRGSIGAPVAMRPGEYRATWSIPSGSAGIASLTAALADRPQLTQVARVTLEPGPASRVTFAAPPPRIVAGESEALLEVTARDAAGNASPQQLKFETSFGELATESASPGRWRLHLRIPPNFGGRTSVRVVARGESDAAVELPLAPASLSRVELDAAAVAPADGERAVPVRVAVRDEYGNLVHAVPVLAVDAGTLSTLAEQDGEWMATWRPPLLREPGRASLTASAGAVTTEQHIDLRPREQLVALSPKVGVLSNFSDWSSPLLGVEAALHWDRLGPTFELLGQLTWSFSSVSNNAAITPSSTQSVRSRTDYLTAAIAAGGFFSIDGRTRAFAHLGPTLSRVSSSLQIGAQPSSSAATLVPGAEISIGLERRMWHTLPFIEVQASIGADPSLSGVLSGSARWLAFNTGARFELL